MYSIFRHKRELYAGGLMVLVGLGVALEASTYPMGTLGHMGPGFFPLALGVILTLIGIFISATSLSPAGEESESTLPDKPQWRGWLCILGGPLLFIVFGHYTGLLLATFACVFVSAFGDRETTLKEALTLATVVTVCGLLLFSYVLNIPFPLLRGHS